MREESLQENGGQNVRNPSQRTFGSSNLGSANRPILGIFLDEYLTIRQFPEINTLFTCVFMIDSKDWHW
jgi:hypothetical protein